MTAKSKSKTNTKKVKDVKPALRRKKIVVDTNVKRSKRTKKPVEYDVLVGLDGKVKEVVPVNDSFSNPWANIGFGTDSILNKTEYPLTRMSYDYNLMNSLYRDNWLVQNIISLIPEDMCKSWFDITCDIDNKLLDRYNKVVRKTHLKQKIKEGLKWGRLYGGAIGLILIEGQEDNLDKPLDLQSIELDSFKGLYIVDRWNGVEPDVELVDNINDPNFGNPKYYNILNDQGGVMERVHHSRIIKFIGRELPHFEKIAEQYWGSSEIESVYQEVIKRDNVSANLANLTFKANIAIYEMENVDQLFAIAGTQAQKRFWNMISAQQILESNFSTRVINKGDAYHREQYTFNGLAEIYDVIMMDVSGSTHIPVTKLFGRSPAGMNSTGESDLQNYYDYLEQEREEKLTPVIEKLLPILAMSTFGKIPDDLDFEYNDIRILSEEKKIEIGSQKANLYLQTFQSGLTTQKTTLEELSKLSNKYGIYTTIDEDMINNAQDKTYTELQGMQDPMAGLSYDEEGQDEEQSNDMVEEGNTNEEQNNNNEEVKDEIENKSIISKVIEKVRSLSNKSKTIESGEKQPEYLIGPQQPIIEENHFEELKQKDLDRVDKLNKASNMINGLVEELKKNKIKDYYQKSSGDIIFNNCSDKDLKIAYKLKFIDDEELDILANNKMFSKTSKNRNNIKGIEAMKKVKKAVQQANKEYGVGQWRKYI